MTSRSIFFFNDTATTEIYTLSLHDALPIFKAPWMPDRTEANPNELNQDDARYGFRCCHLKNINEHHLEDRKSGSAGMPRPISYAVFCLKKKNTGSTGGRVPACAGWGPPQED